MTWEFALLDKIQSIRTPFLDFLMPKISFLADNGYLWILMALVFLCMAKNRRTGIMIALALILNLILCNGICKPLVHRIRPYDINTHVELLVKALSDYSFPSGHSSASFAAVAALAVCGRKKLWKASAVVAVLIAFSRLYLYVHYPTDVLGGIVLGCASGWLSGFLWTKWEERKKKNL